MLNETELFVQGFNKKNNKERWTSILIYNNNDLNKNEFICTESFTNYKYIKLMYFSYNTPSYLIVPNDFQFRRELIGIITLPITSPHSNITINKKCKDYWYDEFDKLSDKYMDIMKKTYKNNKKMYINIFHCSNKYNNVHMWIFNKNFFTMVDSIKFSSMKTKFSKSNNIFTAYDDKSYEILQDNINLAKMRNINTTNNIRNFSCKYDVETLFDSQSTNDNIVDMNNNFVLEENIILNDVFMGCGDIF